LQVYFLGSCLLRAGGRNVVSSPTRISCSGRRTPCRRRRLLMSKSKKSGVDRRKFLKTAAVGGVATLMASSSTARAQQSLAAQPAAKLPAVPRPEADPTGEVEVISILDRSGSDFMVDVIKSLNFEFVASNPGSSFRGIHESLINYGG